VENARKSKKTQDKSFKRIWSGKFRNKAHPTFILGVRRDIYCKEMQCLATVASVACVLTSYSHGASLLNP
jgi:hypothetical protein